MAGTPSGLSLAAEYCRATPDAPTRTVAKRLYADHGERFANLESARKSVLQVRGRNGKQKAHQKHTGVVPRDAQPSGWKPECPPSSAEPWGPVQIDGPARILSLSDLHVPYHDRDAIVAAVEYAKKKHRPNVLLLNGDVGDFYAVSRWQKNPKKRDFAGELRTIREMLEWLAAMFPKARRIYKLGNHDERWDHWVWNHAAEMAECEHMQLHEILKFVDYGFERVDDQPILCGKLPVLHGHEFGKSGIAAPVNPARGAFLRTLHTCLVGHLHRTSSHAESDMWNSEIMTWSQGALCSLSPDYSRINRWNHGWAYVEVGPENSFDVFNYRIGKDYAVRQS